MLNPIPMSCKQLLNLFEDRGMQVSPEDEEKIKHINYYKLKEFAHPLSKITKVNGTVTISYEGVKFKDIIKRYYLDKNLRIHLLHAIEIIEVSIKSVTASQFGLKYGAYGYLKFWTWVNRSKLSEFELEEKQHEFKKHMLACTKRCNNYELNIAGNKNEDGFPTIWLAVDILTFGDIVKMLEIMNNTMLQRIAAEYNATSEEFLSWINCLNYIRNVCAHNSNLIDVVLKTKPKCRKSWSSHLYIMQKNGNPKGPTNRVALVICIAMYMVKMIDPCYHLSNIQRDIGKLCDSSEDSANRLGFASLEDANEISEYIVDEINSAK